MLTEMEETILDHEERATLTLSRAERLADLLRLRIVAGGIQPNIRLAPMRTLALQLGTSRVTLSSAVEILRAQGYLVARRGASGGLFVGDLKEPANRWVVAMRQNTAQLDDILGYRLAVETRTAAIAARRRDDLDLARLHETLDTVEGTQRRGGYNRSTNWLFHEAVAEASKSPRLRAASRRARGEMWSPSSWLNRQDQAEHVIPMHRAIVQAIMDRDSTKAAVAMMADIESTRVVLRGLMEHDTLLGEDYYAALREAERHSELLSVFARHLHKTLIFRFEG